MCVSLCTHVCVHGHHGPTSARESVCKTYSIKQPNGDKQVHVLRRYIPVETGLEFGALFLAALKSKLNYGVIHVNGGTYQ